MDVFARKRKKERKKLRCKRPTKRTLLNYWRWLRQWWWWWWWCGDVDAKIQMMRTKDNQKLKTNLRSIAMQFNSHFAYKFWSVCWMLQQIDWATSFYERHTLSVFFFLSTHRIIYKCMRANKFDLFERYRCEKIYMSRLSRHGRSVGCCTQVDAVIYAIHYSPFKLAVHSTHTKCTEQVICKWKCIIWTALSQFDCVYVVNYR